MYQGAYNLQESRDEESDFTVRMKALLSFFFAVINTKKENESILNF